MKEKLNQDNSNEEVDELFFLVIDHNIIIYCDKPCYSFCFHNHLSCLVVLKQVSI